MRSVILLGVTPPYDAAVGRLAVAGGMRVIRAGGDLTAMVEQAEPVLCVTTVEGDAGHQEARVRAVQKQLSGCPLVVLGHRIGADLALRLVRAGVTDVIDIPGPTADVAARAFAWCAPERARAESPSALIGESEPMRTLRQRLADIAPLHTSVLLQGETGTGKGLVARIMHDRSPWAEEPWVHVDCAALSPTLIESELFGHERGAFTGASERRVGRFEQAGLGTVFLDEIGDLSLKLQTKLLRVLQDREFERLGGSRAIRMEARIVAATSRDLRAAVQADGFRSDLYYRLAVTTLRIPPLRHRLSDLPLLVREAVPRICERLALPQPQISDDFYALLQQHPWPGNVRELFNVLETCLVRVRSERLEAQDLDEVLEEALPPVDLLPPPAAGSEDSLLATGVGSDEERALLERVLVETGGNIARAARRLGVKRSTLRYRIARAGLRYLIPRD